ncbi:zeta toxin family protein [Paenarthrobacter ilicis]|uniref:zeta toxin family protein n=1 Tax=Paenarthrobacter ilicis TaxID=43665 RepID=UPI0028D0322C|nr:zeta toxin family protein [Paenarthrobacter ilicis]
MSSGKLAYEPGEDSHYMSIPAFDEADFDAYCEAVDLYEQTWHTEPKEPQRSFLASRPKLKAELFQRALAGKRTFTPDVYKEDAGWEPERALLQSNLLSSGLGSGTSPAGENETVYFLIGLPGSGKSTALRPMVMEHSGLAAEAISVSDADHLRSTFPEYAGGLGSGVVQDECVELMYDRRLSRPERGLQGAILNAGGVTIVDVIGSPEHLPPLVRRLRRLKRRVYILQASCETSTCVQRAKSRALTNGRFVPLEVILSKEGVPERTLEAVKASAKPTGWAVVDTNGLVPKIVDSAGFELLSVA